MTVQYSTVLSSILELKRKIAEFSRAFRSSEIICSTNSTITIVQPSANGIGSMARYRSIDRRYRYLTSLLVNMKNVSINSHRCRKLVRHERPTVVPLSTRLSQKFAHLRKEESACRFFSWVVSCFTDKKRRSIDGRWGSIRAITKGRWTPCQKLRMVLSCVAPTSSRIWTATSFPDQLRKRAKQGVIFFFRPSHTRSHAGVINEDEKSREKKTTAGP